MLKPRTVLLEIEIDAMLKLRTIHTDIEIDAMLKLRTIHTKIEIYSMLKPRTVILEIEIYSMLKPKSRSTILKGPFSNREDFDDDFSIFSMSRSWLTFEVENTEIENAENGFFPECTHCTQSLTAIV